MLNPIIEDIKSKIKDGNPVTRLIIINVGVFLALSVLRILLFLMGGQEGSASFENSIITNLSLPLSIEGIIFKPWTLITYMFTHIDLFHLLFNMVILHWFGEIVINFTTAKKVIPLYLLGGLAGGAITAILFSVFSGSSPHLNTPMLGASASISAIVIGAATLVPNFKVNMLFIGPVKLLYLALFILFVDILNVASYSNIGGNLSHLGGALMGYIFIVQYKKGNDLSIKINRFLDWASALLKSTRKSKMKVSHKRPVSDEDYNYSKKVNQQEVDAILDKITKSGYESLSKSEKQKLFKASK